ncbi:MAG: type II toxin-antitoxin system VapC family toxin [Planctomycetes bacterium]|nr:type II toxin-antitoxin system VapC family toxin [Planctomycetota bacterium]
MIVVDASALLDVLLRTPDAAKVEAKIFRSAETLHAPHLIDVEIAQVLRRYVARREVAERRGREAIQDLADFPLTRYPHTVFLPGIWRMCGHLTAYDAAYVCLAEALGAPLITRDARLSGARGHKARIVVV